MRDGRGGWKEGEGLRREKPGYWKKRKTGKIREKGEEREGREKGKGKRRNEGGVGGEGDA